MGADSEIHEAFGISSDAAEDTAIIIDADEVQEINARRAESENADALRLARAL